MLDSFQYELETKPPDIKLLKGEDQNETEINSGHTPSGPRHCPSTESWRTDTSVHENEQRVPNRSFRERLGNSLSMEEIPQQQLSMRDSHEAILKQSVLTLVALPRADTPAVDVFISLAAKVAADEPSWDFGDLSKDDSGNQNRSES